MPRLGQTGHPPTWKSARTSPSSCRKRGKSHQKRLGSCALGRPASRGKYVQQTSLHAGRAEQLAQKKVVVADRLQQLQGSVDAMGVALGVLQRGFQHCSGREPESWPQTSSEGAGFREALEDAADLLRTEIAEREKALARRQAALERQEAAARIKAAFYPLKMEDLPLPSVFWQRLIGRHEGTTVASEVEA